MTYYNRSNREYKLDDWICLACTTNCHSNRKICFQCPETYENNRKREESGDFFVGNKISDTLIIRNLPRRNVTERDIIRKLSKNQMQAKKVCFEKRGTYCFVLYDSEDLAKKMLDHLMKYPVNFDENILQPGFSAISMDKVLELDYYQRVCYIFQGGRATISSSAVKSAQAKQLAMNALGSGAMCNSLSQDQYFGGFHGNTMHNSSIGRSIKTPFGSFPVCERPNPSTFTKDPNSSDGYLIDHKTNYRYDPLTTLFFDINDRLWKIWIDKYNCYVPADGGNAELKKELANYNRKLPFFQTSTFFNTSQQESIPMKRNEIESTSKTSSFVKLPIVKEEDKNEEIKEEHVITPLSLKSTSQIRINIGSSSTGEKVSLKRKNLFDNIEDDEEIDISKVRTYKPKKENQTSNLLNRRFSSKKIPQLADNVTLSHETSKMNENLSVDEEIDLKIKKGEYAFVEPIFFEYIRNDLIVHSLEEIEDSILYKDPVAADWSNYICYICAKQYDRKDELVNHIINDESHKVNINSIGTSAKKYCI
uniref:OCRE domain-containing protein n=1 Tax=Parastrongyloides trichosuri TaxID=131310 RepID=A0A0N4ZPM1_PARTI